MSKSIMSKSITKKECCIQIKQLAKSRFIKPSNSYSNPFSIEVDDDFEKVPPPTKSELEEIISFMSNNDVSYILNNWKGLHSFRNEKA